MIALQHRPINGMEDDLIAANVRNVPQFDRGDLLHKGGSDNWSNGVLERWSVGLLGDSHYSVTPVLHHSNLFLLFEPGEDLFGIFVKNLLLLFRRQPRNAFDVRPHVVVPLAGARIGL
jgi:hypothetical protein